MPAAIREAGSLADVIDVSNDIKRDLCRKVDDWGRHVVLCSLSWEMSVSSSQLSGMV